jgi:hypothetical protein
VSCHQSVSHQTECPVLSPVWTGDLLPASFIGSGAKKTLLSPSSVLIKNTCTTVHRKGGRESCV